MIKKGVIVAGGKGSRMGDNLSFTQKCLLPINGKPILQYVIENMVWAGLEEIIVLTKYRAEDVEHFLKNLNQFKANIFSVATEAKGTAKAVKSLEDEINDNFLYSHGNIIYPSRWAKEVINRFHNKRSQGVLTVSPIDLITTHPHVLGDNGKIRHVFFPNGDKIPKDAWCALELSVFSPIIFDLLTNVADDAKLCECLTDEALRRYDYQYYLTEGMWIHIEVPNDLVKANSQVNMVLDNER